jgi:hypothetical protein
MKKSAPKKLVLNKETVRTLEEQDLRKAAGGFSEDGACQTGTCGWSMCICQ